MSQPKPEIVDGVDLTPGAHQDARGVDLTLTTTYEDLLPDATPLEVRGTPILVLSIERLIEAKRKLDRPKDRLMLLQLESLLEEIGKQR